MSERSPWNWNLHYHRLVLDAVPAGATTAVDIGCGDGLLSFDLADRGLQVTGIDVDAPSIGRGRASTRASARTDFVVGDVLTHPFAPSSFDVVASIAMLHHVDATLGVRRMRELVRPGGVIAIVGFARPSGVADVARGLAGANYKRVMKITGRYWEHAAPTCWPPPCTMTEMRALVDAELPGARFCGLFSGRYGVVWNAPESTPA